MMFGPKDPFPNFMPQWTHAIEFVHKKCKKEIKESLEEPEERGVTVRVRDVIISLISRKFELSYCSGSSCLIGEAHRFSDMYSQSHTSKEYCLVCRDLCFGPAAQACESIEKLYDFKREVMEHFKVAHPELSKVGQCNG